MTQNPIKLISVILLASVPLYAACKQAPTRPTLISLGERHGGYEDDDANPDKGGTSNDTDTDSGGDGDTDTDTGADTDTGMDGGGGDTDTKTPDTNTGGTDPKTPDTDMGGKDPMTPTPEMPKEPTVRELLTEAQFNKMLPDRIPFYTYQGFIEAAEATPLFAKEGTIEVRKREIAAILANAMHESDHFKAVREYNMAVWGHYCMPSAEYPCTPGQTYQGRGPIQLSWNYNYKDAGKDLGIDLLNNPDLVATDPKVAFQTMMWFWMKRGNITCHAAIVKGDFAQTIRTINGGLECSPTRNATQAAQAQVRGENFKKILKEFGLNADGEKLDCL